MDSYAAIKKHVVGLYLLARRDGCHILLSREGCLQNKVCNNSPRLKIFFGTEGKSGRTCNLWLVSVVRGLEVTLFSRLLLGWGMQCQTRLS